MVKKRKSISGQKFFFRWKLIFPKKIGRKVFVQFVYLSSRSFFRPCRDGASPKLVSLSPRSLAHFELAYIYTL